MALNVSMKQYDRVWIHYWIHIKLYTYVVRAMSFPNCPVGAIVSSNMSKMNLQTFLPWQISSFPGAGSNAIHEFLALEKPMLLIPLSKQASRGDQILNASSFEKAGYAHVLQEEDLSGQTLQDALQVVEQNRLQMQQAMKQFSPDAPMEKIITAIEQLFMTRRKKSH